MSRYLHGDIKYCVISRNISKKSKMSFISGYSTVFYSHIHSSRMESRGTNPGVTTVRSSFVRLYLVLFVLRRKGGSGCWSDERVMEVPERAIFAAAFASLPLVVWWILLAGHWGWTHSTALCKRMTRSLPSTVLRAQWRVTLEKQNRHVFEELYSFVIATFP